MKTNVGIAETPTLFKGHTSIADSVKIHNIVCASIATFSTPFKHNDPLLPHLPTLDSPYPAVVTAILS